MQKADEHSEDPWWAKKLPCSIRNAQLAIVAATKSLLTVWDIYTGHLFTFSTTVEVHIISVLGTEEFLWAKDQIKMHVCQTTNSKLLTPQPDYLKVVWMFEVRKGS